MELHQLRYFLAIAQHGSFTAAAEVCHVSQPSLSSQVAKLEGELGGPLFERSRQGSRLTPRGLVFRPRALEALSQLESGRSELEELSGLKRGEVTLGCLPTTGAYILPRILRSFRETHPSVQVKLREESSPTLGRALRETEVDLALMDEAGLGDGLRSEVLFREPLLVVVPRDHPFAARKRISLGRLDGEPIILMKSGHGFRKIVLDALARAGVEPRIVYESSGHRHGADPRGGRPGSQPGPDNGAQNKRPSLSGDFPSHPFADNTPCPKRLQRAQPGGGRDERRHFPLLARARNSRIASRKALP